MSAPQPNLMGYMTARSSCVDGDTPDGGIANRSASSSSSSSPLPYKPPGKGGCGGGGPGGGRPGGEPGGPGDGGASPTCLVCPPPTDCSDPPVDPPNAQIGRCAWYIVPCGEPTHFSYEDGLSRAACWSKIDGTEEGEWGLASWEPDDGGGAWVRNMYRCP